MPVHIPTRFGFSSYSNQNSLKTPQVQILKLRPSRSTTLMCTGSSPLRPSRSAPVAVEGMFAVGSGGAHRDLVRAVSSPHAVDLVWQGALCILCTCPSVSATTAHLGGVGPLLLIPGVPTAIWGVELTRRRRRWCGNLFIPLLKSNNPQLTGGEKRIQTELQSLTGNMMGIAKRKFGSGSGKCFRHGQACFVGSKQKVRRGIWI